MKKTFRNTSLNIECNANLEKEASWLLSLLDKNLPAEDLYDGLSVSIGWSKVTFSKLDDGFSILEPDFSRDPFLYLREDISTTLLVLYEQIHLLRTLNVEGQNCSFQDKIILRKGCFEESRIFMERSFTDSPGDTGWFIGIADDEETDVEDPSLYEAIYSYQLLSNRPKLIQFLLLPFDYLVLLKGESVEAVVNSEGSCVMKGN